MHFTAALLCDLRITSLMILLSLALCTSIALTALHDILYLTSRWSLCSWRGLLSTLWHGEENDSDIPLSRLQPTSQPIRVWPAFRGRLPHSLSAAITFLVLDSGNLDLLRLPTTCWTLSHHILLPEAAFGVVKRWGERYRCRWGELWAGCWSTKGGLIDESGLWEKEDTNERNVFLIVFLAFCRRGNKF